MVTPYKLSIFKRSMVTPYKLYLRDQWSHLQVIFKRSTPYKLYLRDQWSHPTSYI